MEKFKIKSKYILSFFIISVVSTLFTIMMSYITGEILDRIYDQSILVDLPLFLAKICLIIGLTVVFVMFKNIYKSYIVKENIRDLRRSLYSNILNLSLGEFKDFDQSYYHNLIYSDVESIRKNYFTPKLSLVDNIILLSGGLVFITRIHPIFLPIAIGATFIPYMVPRLFQNRLKEERKVYSEKSENYISTVKEGVLGLDIIKDYGIEDDVLRDFDRPNDELLDQGNIVSDISSIINSSAVFSGFFMYGFVLSVGVYFYTRGWISVGEILVASQLTNSIKSPIISIINNRININSTESIREKMETVLSVEALEQTDYDFRFKDHMEVKDLSFSYDGNTDVLKSVNLDIEKNKKYLIVGESGSGKSTFLKILMKWYEDYSGDISVDGKDIRNISLNSWNKEVIPVLQEPYMFEKSIAFNISLTSEYDKEEMVYALEIAGLTELIESLEDGLDTIVKEGSQNISGGEKKRIGIARSIYQDGSILLLDEPYSSLDKMTQNHIEERILDLEDMTVLNISHNIDKGLLKKYDYIIKFEDGFSHVYSPEEYKEEVNNYGK